MQDEDRGEYGLADDGPAVKRPATSASPAPLNQQSIPYATPVDEKPSIEQFMEQKAPLALIAGGIAIELLFACWRLSGKEALWAAMRVAIEIAVSAGLMVPVMWYASKARGFTLGPARVAGIKILAISIAPPALMTVIGTILRVVPLGWAAAWLLSFSLYFALLGVFFSLDHDDTWYCIALIFIVRIAIFVGMLLVAQ